MGVCIRSVGGSKSEAINRLNRVNKVMSTEEIEAKIKLQIKPVCTSGRGGGSGRLVINSLP